MADSPKRRAARTGLAGGRYCRHSLAERLAARTIKHEDGCWLFQGAKVGSKGYGMIMREWPSRKLEYAHRIAWELANGPIPAGLYVCHNCPNGSDNPRCVNPTHLFLGTQQDNIRDAVRKGRWTVRKLTDDDVAQVREMAAAGMPNREIAAVYHVARSTIASIVLGATRTERIGEPLPNVEPVPCVQVPVRGVLHLEDSSALTSAVIPNSVVYGTRQ